MAKRAKPYIPSEHVQAYLKSWFTTSMVNKTKDGVRVELTFDQFMGEILKPHQARSLDKAYSEFRLKEQQDESNMLAYVISWVSYNARSSNVYNTETAIVCTRADSFNRNRPQKGDVLRPEHKANLRKPKKDRDIDAKEAHAQNISEAKKGMVFSDEHKAALRKPKTPWSDERKLARKLQNEAKRNSK